MSHDPTLGARRARWALSFCLTLIFTNTNTDANNDVNTKKMTGEPLEVRSYKRKTWLNL